MKKVVILILGFLCVYMAYAQRQRYLQLHNPSEFARQELLRIPFGKFQKHFGLKVQDTLFTLRDQNGQALPYQLEKLGKTVPQYVLIGLQLAAKGTIRLALTREAPAPVVTKVYARYVVERKDDFAWENDKVAFRAFGKALEGTAEDAQGFDFWAKRTDALIINDWYKKGDYHKDHGQGLDYYAVGQTLGLGDMAFYFDDSVHYSKHYRRYEILDNGPLRTTFKLIYDQQHIAGRKLSLEKTISLDAGSQFNKITVEIKGDGARSMPIVVGLAKRKEEEPNFQWDVKRGVFAYFEPVYGDNNITVAGLILPKGAVKLTDAAQQFLFKLTVKNKKPFTYYAGAAFNKAGGIPSAWAWNKYLNEYDEQIEKPLILSYIK